MAVNGLTSGSDNNDGPYLTASISPTEGALVLLAMIASQRGGINPDAPSSVTGAGLTWVLDKNNLFAATTNERHRLLVYRAEADNPTSGGVTITFPSASDGIIWSIFEITGVDPTTPIIQSNQADSNEAQATSGNVGLAAFDAVTNITIGVLARGDLQLADVTPGAGLTEIHDLTRGSPPKSIATMHGVNVTSVAASWTANARWAMVGYEIALQSELVETGTDTLTVAVSGLEAEAEPGSSDVTLATAGAEAFAEDASATSELVGSGLEAEAETRSTDVTLATAGLETEAETGTATSALDGSGLEAGAETAAATVVLAEAALETSAETGSSDLTVTPAALETLAEAQTSSLLLAAALAGETLALLEEGVAVVALSTTGAEALAEALAADLALPGSGGETILEQGSGLIELVADGLEDTGDTIRESGTTVVAVTATGGESIVEGLTAALALAVDVDEALAEDGIATVSVTAGSAEALAEALPAVAALLGVVEGEESSTSETGTDALALAGAGAETLAEARTALLELAADQAETLTENGAATLILTGGLGNEDAFVPVVLYVVRDGELAVYATADKAGIVYHAADLEPSYALGDGLGVFFAASDTPLAEYAVRDEPSR